MGMRARSFGLAAVSSSHHPRFRAGRVTNATGVLTPHAAYQESVLPGAVCAQRSVELTPLLPKIICATG